MEILFDYKPEKRFCGILVSDISVATITNLLGEPDEIERPESSAFAEDVTVYHFHKHQVTLFFNVNKLLNIAVANPQFKLFDTQVLNLREPELIALFATNGFAKHESDSDWGEKQLVFEDAGVTVFFDNQLISEIFIDV